MTLEEAKQSISILSVATEAGYNPKPAGGGEYKIICPNPDHNDTDASCYINDKANLFHCHGCGMGGSVVDFVMMANGVSVSGALDILGVERTRSNQEKARNKPVEKKPVVPKATPQKTKAKRDYRMNDPKFRTHEYVYRNENGEPVYKAVRYDYPDGSKSFQMVARKPDGTAVMSMKGVIRVPYRLNEIINESKVYVVEGEKCADALAGIGLPSTTTCNGSNGWIKEYARYFQDKDLVIIPDNDDAGRKFASTIADDCADSARSVKILDIFKNKPPKWDIADEILELGGDSVMEILEDAESRTNKIVRGVQIDINTASQLNTILARRYCEWQNGGLDLIRLFPIFGGHNIRPLVGGDVLVINSATGSGKTALAQSIAMAYNEHPIAWFSLELSRTRMHERNLILSLKTTADDIQSRLLAGENLDTIAIDHIHIIDEARVDLDYIDRTLDVFPLLAGEAPRLVIIDYIQLMAGSKGTHNIFERISENAIGLKVLAKKHNVVMCVISQIGRKDEANLSSAKGSGAIEESATMLIGLNKIEQFADIRRLGIYKNTNGESGIIKEIGYEGRFFSFECNASSRRLVSTLDRNEIEEELEEEDELIGGRYDSCPF